MAVSAVSGAPAAYQPNQQNAEFRQTFGQLVSAIKSGDLTGAQQAYAALSQLQSSGAGPANPNSPIAQALDQIGQALQDGDISGAQSALESLGQQARGAHHRHHHHHHHDGSSPPDPASGAAGSGSDGSVNVVV
jgi:hypothetical protein